MQLSKCLAIAVPLVASMAVQRPAPQMRGKTMTRAPPTPRAFDEGVDWLVASVKEHHQLLSRAQEISVTEEVRELSQWCAVRDNLADSLGREPTQAEWAGALGRTAESQSRRCLSPRCWLSYRRGGNS